MTIADPHAIPESEHDVQEYVTEAGQAWDGGDSERAYALYHAIFQSHFTPEHDRSVAAYRCGLTKLNEGDTDTAHAFLNASEEPGAHDALQSMNNATHNDPTPSADHVPETTEQSDAWYAAGAAAMEAQDWDRALGLFQALQQTTCNPPNQMARYEANIGVCLHAQGHDDLARQWFERALPNLSDDALIQHAREMLHTVGGQVAADHSSPAAEQFTAGQQAYESGDAHAARTALEAALHLEGPDDLKGRAHYYLGALDYQERKYADARNHIEAAVHSAPEPERGWAEAALHWRWDEDQQYNPTSI